MIINENEIKTVASAYTKEMNLLVAMEECAELIQELSKIRRKPDSDIIRNNLIEEISDVSICIEIIKFNLNIKDYEVDKMIVQKMKRNLGRVQK